MDATRGLKRASTILCVEGSRLAPLRSVIPRDSTPTSSVEFEDAFGNKRRFLNFRTMTGGKRAPLKDELMSCEEGDESDEPD